MRVGKLDQKIVLLSPTESNVDGEATSSFSTAATVWGDVISERGTEVFEAARTNARETIRVNIHYRSDVTDKWRLTWQGQTYDIVYIDRAERRQGDLWLTAQLVGAL